MELGKAKLLFTKNLFGVMSYYLINLIQSCNSGRTLLAYNNACSAVQLALLGKKQTLYTHASSFVVRGSTFIENIHS